MVNDDKNFEEVVEVICYGLWVYCGCAHDPDYEEVVNLIACGLSEYDLRKFREKSISKLFDAVLKFHPTIGDDGVHVAHPEDRADEIEKRMEALVQKYKIRLPIKRSVPTKGGKDGQRRRPR